MDLYLIFINKIGTTWDDKIMYEFLFSDTTENVDGDDWDEYPANGVPSPPNETFVKMVGKLSTSELNLDVIQDDEKFAVWDAVDGMVAMAWENLDDYDQYPEHRLFFNFGDTLKKVKDKLYERDLILEYKIKKDEQIEE